MTIAAGFRCVDGILLCADSQYTGADKQSRDKIIVYPAGKCTISFVLTGDEDYARSGAYDAYQNVLDLAAEDRNISSVREEVMDAVSKMAASYDEHHANSEERPAFIVSISTETRTELFTAREGAMPPVSDFTCLGTGGYIARYIERAFGRLVRHSMEDTLLIAMYMLAAARKHDMYCGGGVQFRFISGMNASAGFSFEWGPEDERILELERQFALILGAVRTQSDEGFSKALHALNENLASIRSELLAPDSWYWRLMRQTRLLTPAGRLNLPFPTRGPSRQPPSPESPEGSDES